jgi:GNAT superfamily N-acetyltransferase
MKQEIRKLELSEVQEVLRDDPRYGRKRLRPDREYYGVVINGKVVSFGDLKIRGEEAKVSFVYTVPEHRNKGYHELHLKHRIEIARERGAKVMRAAVARNAYDVALKAGYKPLPSPITLMELKLE